MILHVSLNGKKENSGTDEANAISSIQQAYDTIAAEHRRGTLDFPAEIRIHGGTYRISAPLHFYDDLPVQIGPWNDEKVIISGGTPVTGWKKVKLNGKTVLRAEVPPEITALPFLYDGEHTLQAARFPKQDYLRIAKPEQQEDGFTTTPETESFFRIDKGDFNTKWYDPQNIMVRMIHLWCEENLLFDHYDEKNSVIHLRTAIRYMPHYDNTEYCYFNVKEALSEPGEYYFDRLEHAVYYMPLDSKEKPDVQIPLQGSLVRADSNVRWLKLSGLHFRYAGGYTPTVNRTFDLRDTGYDPVTNCAMLKKSFASKRLNYLQSAQGSVQLPGILNFTHASDCVIDSCEVSQCGWYGICLTEACKRITVSRNEFHTLGGGGVFIPGCHPEAYGKDPALETTHIIVTNNHIHDCGQFYLSAVGIMICYGAHCLVEHNHIHDLYYSGISGGWTWGYGVSGSYDNRFGWNLIHDLGKGILSDMGGIYMLGIQPGTRIYHNVIHHVKNRYYGGWGIYTDEGSSHIIVEHNLVFDCSCEGYHQHYGRENIVRNNIFAFGKEHGAAFSRDALCGYESPGIPHTHIMNFYENVIISDGTPFFNIADRKGTYELKKLFSDFNFLVELKKPEVFAKVEKEPVTEEDWHKHGLDRHSMRLDPGFRNLKKYDFRLKKDSILPEYGFEAWDYTLAGIEKK